MPEKQNSREINEPIDSSSDEENDTLCQETANKQETADKTKVTEGEQKHTPETSSKTSRQSQRSKRKPNWYGQNTMVTKVDAKEGENASGSQINKEIGRELEVLPIFKAMRQEEIDHWVNN